MAFALGQLAERFALTLDGDASVQIQAACALHPGERGGIAFCADTRYRAQLGSTRASAVILRAADREAFAGPALIAADPALAFAQLATVFDTALEFVPAIAADASVSTLARLGTGVGVAPTAVIEDGAEIGDGVYIGPGCVVRRGAFIGAESRLEANVYVGERCRIGRRARIQAGAVIGSRGFGLARSKTGWVDVPQLGAVLVGDDVEIGANTCIDRGALIDTVIEDGVKLDNLIQIAHNCRIGAHTAIAACAGIAGSTTIGKRCMIGGAAGIGGHLTIGDDIVVLGLAMITKSLTDPGVYGSGLPVQPAREWRRTVGRVRRLATVDARLARIEQALKLAPVTDTDSGPETNTGTGEHSSERDDT